MKKLLIFTAAICAFSTSVFADTNACLESIKNQAVPMSQKDDFYVVSYSTASMTTVNRIDDNSFFRRFDKYEILGRGEARRALMGDFEDDAHFARTIKEGEAGGWIEFDQDADDYLIVEHYDVRIVAKVKKGTCEVLAAKVDDIIL